MSTLSPTEERPQTRPGLGSMLRRVRIRNYKSIASCDVELKPFTLLVGRNGAGKSNFLNAIRLITDGVNGLPDWAAGPAFPWSGIAVGDALLDPVKIQLSLTLAPGDEVTYEVSLGLQPMMGVTVRHERLDIRRHDGENAYYQCVEGHVVDASVPSMPPAVRDRLYLVRASAIPEFRSVYDALSATGFYNIAPQVIRKTQTSHDGVLLAPDGSNLASVLNFIEHVGPNGKERIASWLGIIIPEFGDIRFQKLGPFTTLVFDRKDNGQGGVSSFYAQGVSDGTLRALGILVAVNQLASDGEPIRLVGIEEPETALHPAAAGALMDALREASTHTQVLVTTHSADLLDLYDPDQDHLLAVQSREGRTEIAPIHRAGREAIQEHLFSAGELLRMDQLDPDWSDVDRQRSNLTDVRDNGS